ATCPCSLRRYRRPSAATSDPRPTDRSCQRRTPVLNSRHTSPAPPEPYRYSPTRTTPPWWLFIRRTRYTSLASTPSPRAANRSRASPPASPLPLAEVNTQPSWTMGVAALTPPTVLRERHSNLPSLGEAPPTRAVMNWTYCLTPPASATTAEA